MLRIENFRYGFATNSSSSHSVVILPDHVVVGDRDADGDFGWNNFICASQEAKLRYLTAQVLANVHPDIARNKLAPAFANVGEDFDDVLKLWDSGDMYIDHQSSMSFKDERLIDALLPIFMSPKVVVLGGNDNSDPFELAPAVPEPVCEAIMANGRGDHVRARIDGDYVTVFDTIDGTKVRIATKEGAEPFRKGTSPELVDLKITDFCDAGCSFCYQSSTEAGKHGDLDEIKGLIDALAGIDVFELAIGGGEPTKHPHFARILSYAAEKNIKPNFTTLSRDWLDDQFVRETVRDVVGAIGVSCLSAKGLELVKETSDAVGTYNKKVMAQHVLGSVPLNVTTKLLNEAFERRIPVLLLGFKTVGFGQGYKRFDEGVDIPSYLRLAVNSAKGKASLSLDTALVDQHPEIVAALGAVEAQVTSPEGAFSCYIDAVERKIAASSYVPPQQMLPLDPSREGIMRAFEGF